MNYISVLSMDDIIFHCIFFKDIWDRQSTVSINICLEKPKKLFLLTKKKNLVFFHVMLFLPSEWPCAWFFVLFSNTEITAWFTLSSYFIAQTKQSTCLIFLSIWDYTISRRLGSSSVSLESKTGKGKRS